MGLSFTAYLVLLLEVVGVGQERESIRLTPLLLLTNQKSTDKLESQAFPFFFGSLRAITLSLFSKQFDFHARD